MLAILADVVSKALNVFAPVNVCVPSNAAKVPAEEMSGMVQTREVDAGVPAEIVTVRVVPKII